MNAFFQYWAISTIVWAVCGAIFREYEDKYLASLSIALLLFWPGVISSAAIILVFIMVSEIWDMCYGIIKGVIVLVKTAIGEWKPKKVYRGEEDV